jgi:molybdopterin-guanine dinucleotide biosynthesis protein A
MQRPKAELLIQGQPILRFLHDQWQWPGPTLIVTAPGREHPPGHELFTKEVPDPVPDQGPLRGIVTALESCQTPTLIVTTVDMPNVTTRELSWLLVQLNENHLGVLCTRHFEGREEIEPFPCTLSIKAKQSVNKHLDSGMRSVHSLAKLPGLAIVSTPEDWPHDVWANLNTPEDYQRFVQSSRVP